MPRKPRIAENLLPGTGFGTMAGRLLRQAAAGAPVAGVDEAGRGPWAGPVVCAAVVLDPSCIPQGLGDSKQLSAAERERLYDLVLANHAVAIATRSAGTIDRINIRAATLQAMAQAVAALCRVPEGVLADGKDVPPGLACPGAAVVKGDSLVAAISAASIVAKVTRDRMMAAHDSAWPGYGFAVHKGYGTAAHAEALNRLGPCPLHRLTFRPVQLAASGGHIAWGSKQARRTED